MAAQNTFRGLVRPTITLDDASRIARDTWGLDGTMRELGSNQDYNLRIEAPAGTVVLKIANPAWSRDELAAQRTALPVLAAAGITAPSSVGEIAEVDVAGQRLLAHVLTYVAGRRCSTATRSASTSAGSSAPPRAGWSPPWPASSTPAPTGARSGTSGWRPRSSRSATPPSSPWSPTPSHGSLRSRTSCRRR